MPEVADLNLKVPDLRSGEIRLTLTLASSTLAFDKKVGDRKACFLTPLGHEGVIAYIDD